ncbi:carbon-nitrogen hydrolase family protein [Nesterenkonia natronophila]|nr:carbon-nitrogen hydrolase family protein [Nesterenkonia natronophila]
MLTVSIAQYAPTADKAHNLDEIERLARRAVSQGAELLVLPEYSIYTLPVMDERWVENAEALDGPVVERLKDLSRELGLALVAGVNEPAGQGRIYNTLLGIKDGEINALYRKVHLYDAFGYKESSLVLHGPLKQPELFSVGPFKVGMQTCYDLRFPEVSRTLVDAGADLLAVPAEWVPGPLKEFHWTTLVRARAIENTVYVAAADQAPPTGSGNSLLLDPMGIALAGVGENTDIATAALHQERLKSVRESNPALSLRRYRVITN